MAKVLVIGGGFSGCCAAHLLSKKKGWDVTVVEKLPFLGGGVRTFFKGGHPYTFGPRHFLSDDIKLFDFLNEYVPMRRIDQVQQNLTFVGGDDRFYSWPIHEDDVANMPDKDEIYQELDARSGNEYVDADHFEDWVIGSVGPTLYNKFVNAYSKKMWQVESNTELDFLEEGWEDFLGDEKRLKRMKLATGSKAFYTHRISAFPLDINGYNDYFDIATRDCTVCLGVMIEEFDMKRRSVKIDGEWSKYDVVVSTIAPDVLLNNAFGPLRWVGRDFLNIILPVPQVFPNDVYFLYYASEDTPYLRIVEYKQFYRYESPSTLLGIEFPSDKNKLYPYPTVQDVQHAQKYFDALPENVFSIGRAGTYRYMDIDDIIAQCLKLDQNM